MHSIEQKCIINVSVLDSERRVFYYNTRFLIIKTYIFILINLISIFFTRQIFLNTLNQHFVDCLT